jgi:hypothetical protein
MYAAAQSPVVLYAIYIHQAIWDPPSIRADMYRVLRSANG